MDDLETELADLRRLLAEQTRRVADLESAVRSSARSAPTRSSPVPTTAESPVADRTTDRRQLLRGVGLAATAVAAGAAVGLGETGVAGAADGDALLMGHVAEAINPTSLVYHGGSTSGFAILSVSDTAFAPAGASAAIWAWATEDVPVGVVAQSSVAGGTGLVATAVGTGLSARGSRAALRLDGTGAAPPTRADAHTRGEIDIDVSGDSWLCIVGGTPGTWRKLGGPSSAGAFHVLAASNRIYDSRPMLAPLDVTKGALAAGVERTIDATHGSAVPVGATAAMVNLTVTDTVGAAFMALFKNGIAWPGTSTLNWSGPGTTLSNLAVVALDANGRFRARCDGVGGSTQFLVDVIGFFR